MTTAPTLPRPTGTTGPTPAVDADRATGRHVAAVLGSATANQVGAAIGVAAFPFLGPAGVVAVRQLVAAGSLVPLARPRVRELSRRDWGMVVGLALVMGVMNLTLYAAIERIGLGLAVTLEFVGPLVVALAGSRRLRDAGIALLAVVGVVVLVDPDPSTDVPGIALALVAAACWAAYILLNRRLGARFAGLEATAIAATIAAVLYLPWLVHVLLTRDVPLWALGAAVATGILASTIPYAVDVAVLRRVPQRVFSVLMSAHPAVAALAGLVVLGQALAPNELLGMAAIVIANVAVVLTGGRRGPRGRRLAPSVT